MSARRVALLVLAWALCGARGAHAQDPAEVEIEARVTAVAGSSVYVDAGRLRGIEVGDRAALVPASGARIDAEVVSVSGSSARVLPLGPIAELDIGARAVVYVPAARLAAAEPAEPAPEREAPAADAPRTSPVPEHPPWSEPPQEWAEGTPLLARVRPRTSAERESSLTGRAYLDGSTSHDAETGETNTLLRAGVDARWRNPAGRGGLLEVDAELYDRSGVLAFDPDSEDTGVRVDRLSYAVGDTRRRPTRVQVGRFVQRGMPEFGLLDGVEVSHRTAGGDRFGGSVGYLPAPTFELGTGEDLQVAGFYQWRPGPPGLPEVSAGLQKTWHEGTPDRDLAVLGVDWAPLDSGYSTSASAWVDFYTGDDTLKSDSVQLTELHWSHRYSFEGRGALALDLTRLRWPELLRTEFLVTPELVSDGELRRAGLSGWVRAGARWRVSARLDAWEDEAESGTGGELRLARADLPVANGETSLAAFRAEGASTEVLGLRLQSLLPTATGRWIASYEVADLQTDGGLAQPDVRHFVRLSWDTRLGGSWTLALHAETRFGGSEDAHALGLSLQRRF